MGYALASAATLHNLSLPPPVYLPVYLAACLPACLPAYLYISRACVSSARALSLVSAAAGTGAAAAFFLAVRVRFQSDLSLEA